MSAHDPNKGDCLMGDSERECDGFAFFPMGDTIGFCPKCWAELPLTMRRRIQRLTHTANDAQARATKAIRRADGAINEAQRRLAPVRSARGVEDAEANFLEVGREPGTGVTT